MFINNSGKMSAIVLSAGHELRSYAPVYTIWQFLDKSARVSIMKTTVYGKTT